MDKKPAHEEIDHGIKDPEKENVLKNELEKVMQET